MKNSIVFVFLALVSFTCSAMNVDSMRASENVEIAKPYEEPMFFLQLSKRMDSVQIETSSFDKQMLDKAVWWIGFISCNKIQFSILAVLTLLIFSLFNKKPTLLSLHKQDV